jgi:regulator of extracellular matrix RemA (YlzA/DUF370 family)
MISRNSVIRSVGAAQALTVPDTAAPRRCHRQHAQRTGRLLDTAHGRGTLGTRNTSVLIEDATRLSADVPTHRLRAA